MTTSIDKKISMIDVEKIVPASFNPPKRTSTQSIKELKDSIAEVGIIYPILVDENFGLIDGHRRLACAKALNLKTVPALTAHGDSRKLFDDVNRTSTKLSKKDELYIFLSGGPISNAAKQTISKLGAYLDKKDLEYAADNRYSASGLLFVIELAKNYIKKEREVNAAFAKRLAKYILYNSQSYAIRMAITQRMEVGLMVAAVEANTPIS